MSCRLQRFWSMGNRPGPRGPQAPPIDDRGVRDVVAPPGNQMLGVEAKRAIAFGVISARSPKCVHLHPPPRGASRSITQGLICVAAALLGRARTAETTVRKSGRHKGQIEIDYKKAYTCRLAPLVVRTATRWQG